MSDTNFVLFRDGRIRSHLNTEQGNWFFSVVDGLAALTDSANPTDYLKKLLKRDLQLGKDLGTNCPQVAVRFQDGFKGIILAATTVQLSRIIQSTCSKKAEPLKPWFAKVANRRVEQLQNPGLAIEQAMLNVVSASKALTMMEA